MSYHSAAGWDDGGSPEDERSPIFSGPTTGGAVAAPSSPYAAPSYQYGAPTIDSWSSALDVPIGECHEEQLREEVLAEKASEAASRRRLSSLCEYIEAHGPSGDECYLLALSTELIARISTHLSRNDILRLGATCRHLRHKCASDWVWARFVRTTPRDHHRLLFPRIVQHFRAAAEDRRAARVSSHFRLDVLSRDRARLRCDMCALYCVNMGRMYHSRRCLDTGVWCFECYEGVCDEQCRWLECLDPLLWLQCTDCLGVPARFCLGLPLLACECSYEAVGMPDLCLNGAITISAACCCACFLCGPLFTVGTLWVLYAGDFGVLGIIGLALAMLVVVVIVSTVSCYCCWCLGLGRCRPPWRHTDVPDYVDDDESGFYIQV